MIEYSLEILSGGQSQMVPLTSASAQSTAIAAPPGHPAGVPVPVLVYCTADAFVRRGADPTALSDGTDQILVAGVQYRAQALPGERLALVAVSPLNTGTAYITPGA